MWRERDREESKKKTEKIKRSEGHNEKEMKKERQKKIKLVPLNTLTISLGTWHLLDYKHRILILSKITPSYTQK